MKLSVVLATRNEEANLKDCLESVKDIADEIIVVDEESADSTVKVAESYGAKVFSVKHEEIFHINKQKALSQAKGDWILQLDADERVTSRLAKEIIKATNLSYSEISERFNKFPENKKRLFLRHAREVEKSQGRIGKKTGEYVAFFLARKNFFLGKPLIHAGVYPDGVIRLVKKGKAKFPAKSVHELMEINGEVSWLLNDLQHYDTPNFNRYIERMNRYTELRAGELKQNRIPLNCWNLFKYSFVIPFAYFLKLYIFHKGFLDGTRGFIWSLFSGLHYPVAYFKYLLMEQK